MLALHAAASFLPVLLFLVVLRAVDTYRLVDLKSLVGALSGGAVMAVGAYFLNDLIRDGFGLSQLTLTRYAAPALEELLKALVVVLLLRLNRVGFLVDAAIFGFSVGAGFACLENLYFLTSRDLSLAGWIVRGLGTAVMHGGATAVFAILAKRFVDVRDGLTFVGVAPALLGAFLIHAAYNHFVLPPVLSAAVVALSVPVLVAVVFSRSEAATRTWINDGFDADQEVLRLMETGTLSDTRIGEYLSQLRSRFPGEILVDMLCLVRLEAELSVRAKGILMMREAGFDPKPDNDLKAKIKETQYLEKSVGLIGLKALDPFLAIKGRERWQRQVLGVR